MPPIALNAFRELSDRRESLREEIYRAADLQALRQLQLDRQSQILVWSFGLLLGRELRRSVGINQADPELPYE